MPRAKPEIVAATVVRLLKESRIDLKVSMNVAAQRAGLSHTFISRVERELRKPTLDTLLRITEGLGVDLWPFIKTAEEEFARNAKSTREKK